MNEPSPIRIARKNAKLTQQALADWLEIPIRTIQNWEGHVNTPPKWAEKLIVEKIEKEAHTIK